MKYKKPFKGKFIMIDGIDGSGKGTVVSWLENLFTKKGYKVFNLDNYAKKKRSFPEPSELKNYKVVISSEPTYSMVGQAIREEIIKDNNRYYTAHTTAEAFALDRKLLYKRVIIPALKRGMIVVQERGVSTSYAYQPIQREPLALKKIMNFMGNIIALKFRPDLLIITTVNPREAIKRTKKRRKTDEAIFEREGFLKKAQKRFTSSWFKEIFERKGGEVVYLDTDKPKKDTKAEVLDLFNKHVKQ